jgi:predicted nucleotidyltransferase
MIANGSYTFNSIILTFVLTFKVFPKNTFCPMRLSDKELTSIKAVTKQVFGENAMVTLFGSRIEDGKRGGDIDLLIKCDKTISRDEIYQLKLKFLVELKKRIGDQKIDVIIYAGQVNDSIFKTILKEAILL